MVYLYRPLISILKYVCEMRTVSTIICWREKTTHPKLSIPCLGCLSAAFVTESLSNHIFVWTLEFTRFERFGDDEFQRSVIKK